MRRAACCMTKRLPKHLPKHLHDALTAAEWAREFLGELDAAAHRSNVLLRSAVGRQLEILGEACKRVLDEAPDLRERAPACPGYGSPPPARTWARAQLSPSALPSGSMRGETAVVPDRGMERAVPAYTGRCAAAQCGRNGVSPWESPPRSCA